MDIRRKFDCKNKTTLLFFITIVLFVFCCINIDSSSDLFAKAKSTKKNISKQKSSNSTKSKISKKTKSKSKESSKSKSTKNTPSNKRLKKSSTKISSKSVFEIQKEIDIAEGVIYQKILMGKGRLLHTVHLLKADLYESGYNIAVLKANNKSNDLEKLQSMIRTYDSINGNKILGAVNANFWRAYSNTPIGPNIINGEVVELKTHKQWSSCFFDEESKPYIDNFFMKGYVTFNFENFKIDNVNRRLDSTEVILYNTYGADTIPYIKPQNLEQDLNEVLKAQTALLMQDTLFNDSTEIELDTLGIKKDIIETRRSAALENSFAKVALRYLNAPAINKEIECQVIKIVESGPIEVPEHGCVLTFGSNIPKNKLPQLNDVIKLQFSTDKYDEIVFYNAISGTPRLVRNGIAKHEALFEGSRKKRFINKGLPRTAIGTNKIKNMIYLLVVEARSKKERGASLQQLSNIMHQLGAYDAMNLDGGGSSIMVVDNKNILYSTRPEASRKLSVGIGIVLDKNKNK
jgi:hypothetical protein